MITSPPDLFLSSLNGSENPSTKFWEVGKEEFTFKLPITILFILLNRAFYFVDNGSIISSLIVSFKELEVVLQYVALFELKCSGCDYQNFGLFQILFRGKFYYSQLDGYISSFNNSLSETASLKTKALNVSFNIVFLKVIFSKIFSLSYSLMYHQYLSYDLFLNESVFITISYFLFLLAMVNILAI